MVEVEKLIFGYPEQKLKGILTELYKTCNWYEMFDWFERNAPDQTYVNERTVDGVIENFIHLNVIKYGQMEHVCAYCNNHFFTDHKLAMYCSCKCQSNELKRRKELQKLDPNYKPPIRSTHAKTPYELKEKVTYEDSFNTELTGNDSLFCDTEFLEKFLGKPVKKTEKCD